MSRTYKDNYSINSHVKKEKVKLRSTIDDVVNNKTIKVKKCLLSTYYGHCNNFSYKLIYKLLRKYAAAEKAFDQFAKDLEPLFVNAPKEYRQETYKCIFNNWLLNIERDRCGTKDSNIFINSDGVLQIKQNVKKHNNQNQNVIKNLYVSKNNYNNFKKISNWLNNRCVVYNTVEQRYYWAELRFVVPNKMINKMPTKYVKMKTEIVTTVYGGHLYDGTFLYDRLEYICNFADKDYQMIVDCCYNEDFYGREFEIRKRIKLVPTIPFNKKDKAFINQITNPQAILEPYLNCKLVR